MSYLKFYKIIIIYSGILPDHFNHESRTVPITNLKYGKIIYVDPQHEYTKGHQQYTQGHQQYTQGHQQNYQQFESYDQIFGHDEPESYGHEEYDHYGQDSYERNGHVDYENYFQEQNVGYAQAHLSIR